MPKYKRPRQDIEAGLPLDHVGSRAVSGYDPGLALEIATRIMNGEVLSEVLSEPGMPSYSTFAQWRLRYPGLQQAVETARAASAEFFEDEALGIARWLIANNSYTSTKVNALKTALDQLRWTAAKRNPARFGQHGVNQGVIVPIQINTSLDLGGDKRDESVYNFTIDAVTPEQNADDQDFNTLLELPEDTADAILNATEEFTPRRPPGRPKGWRKGPHKSPEQTRKTATRFTRAQKDSP